MATLDNYEANLRLARSFSRSYDFVLYCFWQPALVYGHKPLVPFESQMKERDTTGNSLNSVWFQEVAAVCQEAERRAANNGDFVFLGGVFDSVKEPFYIDEGHLGPLGNELAAHAIAEYIEGRSRP